MSDASSSIKIFYDGHCPFCDRYVHLIRLKEVFDHTALIDLRSDDVMRDAFVSEGYNLDQGMIVQIGAQNYFGAAAVNILASLSTGSGLFNRLNKLFLSHRALATFLYPFMVFFRNLVISLLGHTKLVQDTVRDSYLDVFVVFARVWAIYTVMHFFYLIFYSLGPYQTTNGINTLSVLMAVLAFGVYWKPREFRFFFLLALVQLIEMWSQMPITSNHAIIQFFLNIAMVATGIVALAKGYDWAGYFKLWAPAGRWLLFIMYFYGIFHKINTDFLNPESSCAVALWVDYPFPNFIGQALWAHYVAIYGTFIVEGAVAVALLFSKTRYFAIVIGLLFHAFIGFSDYAFYGAFSFLSFALHALFLPHSILDNYRSSSIARFYERWPRLFAALPVVFLILGLRAAYARSLYGLIFVFAFAALPLISFVVLYGRERVTDYGETSYFKLPILAALVVFLFFLNGAMPYMGLKTHQTLTMFSNLHLEGGRSNHLVFQDPPSLFGYLDETVRLKKIKQEEFMEQDFSVSDLDLIYHDFLAYVYDHRHYNLLYTFEKDGVLYEQQSYDDLKTEIEKVVLPQIFRKYFFFAGVDFSQPKLCEDLK